MSLLQKPCFKSGHPAFPCSQSRVHRSIIWSWSMIIDYCFSVLKSTLRAPNLQWPATEITWGSFSEFQERFDRKHDISACPSLEGGWLGLCVDWLSKNCRFLIIGSSSLTRGCWKSFAELQSYRARPAYTLLSCRAGWFTCTLAHLPMFFISCRLAASVKVDSLQKF